MPSIKARRQEEFLDRFWIFLASQENFIIEEAKELARHPNDPDLTNLIATLTKSMQPVLESDVAFFAYRDIGQGTNVDTLIVDERIFIVDTKEIQDSPLLKFLNDRPGTLSISKDIGSLSKDFPALILDPEQLPPFLLGKAYALAEARIIFSGREYFLFFCDTTDHAGDMPRYDNFHKKMLQVVIGNLQIGFLSGARVGGEQAQLENGKMKPQELDIIKIEKIEPLAFLSYAHDNNEDGQLTEFCDLLSKEVSGLIGEKFHIFMDINDIEWGAIWRKRLDEGLAQATFLIPIISPTYFRRDECRNELQKFNEKILSRGRHDLILPIYFIDVPQLNENPELITDPLVRLIADTQHEDWRDLRLRKFSYSTKFRKLNKLAIHIRDVLFRDALQV